MHRTTIAALLLVPLAACGQEARRQAEENQARAAAAENALRSAQDQAADEKLDLEAAAARLLGISGVVRDELLEAAQPGVSGEEMQKHAERLLWFVDNEEEFTATASGRRLLVETRLQAALLLVRAQTGYEERARALSGSAIAVAQSALDAAPEDRGAKAVLGDAYAGVARIDRERGDIASAIGSFERAVELLEAADKGRGDGTGSSENRGESSGGGKGRGKGKGRNKAQSLVLKHHTCDVYGELAEVYRLAGKPAEEVRAIGRERLVQGNICQVESTSKDGGYEVARLGMAELIDRLGDATERTGDAADAVKVEQLSLNILRELAEEKPGQVIFTERLVPQAVEIADRWAALGTVEELRTTVVQAFEDLKVLQNLGVPPARMRSDEARLSLAMARGLMQGAAAGTNGSKDYQAEAANWYGRAIESLDGLRVDGALPPQYAELEEAAIVGIEQLQAGG